MKTKQRGKQHEKKKKSKNSDQSDKTDQADTEGERKRKTDIKRA